MSQITTLNEKAIAVEVLPELKDGPVFLDYEELHDEGWRRIGYANELTEEQWKGIVDSVDYDVPPSPGNDWQGDWRSAWRDYDSDIETGYSEYPFVLTAAESGLSLLKSKGLNPIEIIILIKQ